MPKGGMQNLPAQVIGDPRALCPTVIYAPR